jgi:hypothetical protein
MMALTSASKSENGTSNEQDKAEILHHEADKFGEQDDNSQVGAALKKVDRRLLPMLTLLYLLSFLDRGNGEHTSNCGFFNC